MFSKHIKKKPRLVMKLRKLKNIQEEKILEAVGKLIKCKWVVFTALSLATAFLVYSIVFHFIHFIQLSIDFLSIIIKKKEKNTKTISNSYIVT